MTEPAPETVVFSSPVVPPPPPAFLPPAGWEPAEDLDDHHDQDHDDDQETHDMPSSTDTTTTTDERPTAGGFAFGELVRFRHPDVLTGGHLEGAGVVLEVPGDGAAVVVAPLSQSVLQVLPEHLTATGQV